MRSRITTPSTAPCSATNRHGDNSSYLRVVPNERLRRLTVEELHGLVASLLSYEHDLSYTGSLPLEEVTEMLLQRYPPLTAALKPPPPFQALEIRRPEETEILFFDKEMAQALVRIESGGETYGEGRRPQIDLFNEYFYGGMAGIVFQELREARALAYATWAWLFPGNRKEDFDLLSAFIGLPGGQDPGGRRGVPGADRRHPRLGGAFRRGAKSPGGAVPHPPARVQGGSGGGAQVGTSGASCRSEAGAFRTDLFLYARTTARLSFGTYRRGGRR